LLNAKVSSIAGLRLERLDKNVTKNMAIIVLVIFLAFSVLVNMFYILKNQALYQQDRFVFSGKFSQRNHTITDVQFGSLVSESAPPMYCFNLVKVT